MKGIIFNLLEHLVVRDHGQQTWELLLKENKLSGIYTALGTYPDEDIQALLVTASAKLQTTPDALLRWFGRQSIPLLAKRYPSLFTPHLSTQAFLLTLNKIIHPQIRILYPGAEVPDFTYNTADSDVLSLTYRSRRQLCSLAQGLIEGAADYYGDTLTLTHPHCVHRGSEACTFLVRCEKISASPSASHA